MFNMQELVLKCLTESGKEYLFDIYRDAIGKMEGLSARERRNCLIDIEERGISPEEWNKRMAEAEDISEKHDDTPYLEKEEKLRRVNKQESLDFSMLDYYERHIIINLSLNHAYSVEEALSIFNQYALPFYTLDDSYDDSSDWALTLSNNKKSGGTAQEWLAHIAKINRYLKE